ncbi:MAG: hypothetical protein MUP98_17210, partial [Candidatus Aminicenantes bacterium]|nr:hypothetical protein [Candidatus Aminicenantes bacterium]
MNKKKLSIPFLCLAVLITAVFFLTCTMPTLFAQGKLYELKYQLAKGTKITMTSTGEVNSVADQMGTEVLTDIYGD